MILKTSKLIFLFIAIHFCSTSDAQYKSYKISVHGDTLNAIDKNGMKQGKWVVHVDPLRGEPGYEEEGIFVNDKKRRIMEKVYFAE